MKEKHSQSDKKRQSVFFTMYLRYRKAVSRKPLIRYRTALLLFFAVMILGLAGCGRDSVRQDTNQPSPVGEQAEEETGTAVSVPTAAPEPIPQKISAQQAKELMDTNSDLILLDVRTQEEYDEGHIEGALLIPDYEINDKAEEQLTDKDTTILIYCRSGRRSALAAQALSDLGYSSVYDFGGIIDWPYEVITETK